MIRNAARAVLFAAIALISSTACKPQVISGRTGECPFSVCGHQCRDLNNDEQHCGTCGPGCAGGQACSAGRCVDSCGAQLANCDGSCVDLSNDTLSCGSCGRICPRGTGCLQGDCIAACTAGMDPCEGHCVDLEA